MKIYLRKTLKGLQPADDEAAKCIKRFAQGDTFECEIKKPRNYEFHKKAFALFTLVFDNQERYDTLEDLLVEFKLRTGHYKEHITARGVMVYVPKSISFAQMEECDFQEFYSKAINVALKYFIPGSTREEIDRAVNEVLSFAA
jgi:hypothetical protein